MDVAQRGRTTVILYTFGDVFSNRVRQNSNAGMNYSKVADFLRVSVSQWFF